jgi:hypothetical protein
MLILNLRDIFRNISYFLKIILIAFLQEIRDIIMIVYKESKMKIDIKDHRNGLN